MLQTMKNKLIVPQVSLSWKVFEFWVFWFALCSILGFKGVFVTIETKVGYRDWRKHTSGRLSDTFQTTGRQSDFRSNHRRVICNYPFYLSTQVVGVIYFFLLNLIIIVIKKWHQEPKYRWTTVTHTLPSFDDAKQVFSPPPDALNYEEQADRTSGLSLEKFLSFGCFDSRHVLFWG